MERVAFLLEESDQHLSCLLNPESLVLRRAAGIQPRRAAAGQLSGAGLRDDPLLFTGGGRTELDLDLLFDIELGGSSITTDDVRDLTRPLWELAENSAASEREGYTRPPMVRLVWGKSWNLPGVVVAVAERLERFTPTGLPQRSWLRMRLLRLSEPLTETAAPVPRYPSEAEGGDVHQIIGGEGGPPPGVPEGAEGITTPDDIFGAALAETSAWQTLTAARQAIGAATGSILSELAALEGAEAEGAEAEEVEEEAAAAGEKRTAAQAIRSAIGAVSAFADEIGAAGAAGVVSAVNAAAEAIGPITEVVSASADRLAAAGAPTAADKIRDAFGRVGSAVERMAAAAGRVAVVVREKSAALIASAARTMDTTVQTIRAGVGRLGTLPSAAFDTAEALVQTAAEIIGETVEKVSSFGETIAFEHIPTALEKMGTAVEVLWQAGSRTATDVVGRAVETLATALKNATAAAEAIASVTTDRAAAAIRSAVETIRTTLGELETQGAAAAAAALRGALRTIRTMLAFVAPRPEAEALDPVPAALEGIRAAADALETAPEEASVPTESLDTITEAVDAMVQAEASVTAEMIKAAAEEEARAAVPAPRPEETTAAREPGPVARTRVRVGERLDQIAYRFYRDPAFWRTLAAFNGIDDPLHLPPGRLLRIPPAFGFGKP